MFRTVWQEPGTKQWLERVFPLTSQQQVLPSFCEAHTHSDTNRKAPIFYSDQEQESTHSFKMEISWWTFLPILYRKVNNIKKSSKTYEFCS